MLSAHHFPFLASLKRPFTKYSINNFIVPTILITIILTLHIKFEVQEGIFTWERIIYNCLGFIFGMFSLVILLLAYFISTNKDILSYTEQYDHTPPNLIRSISPGRVLDIDEIRSEIKGWRVETYLTESLLPRRVRSVSHYSLKTLLRVFKQNHTNALAVQLTSLIVLAILGALIENPNFRIPAGASIFLLASIVVAILGAIIYWFHHWSFTVFILLFLMMNFMAKQGILNHKNKAYGLNYEVDRPAYQFDSLNMLFDKTAISADSLNTIQILENWKRNMGEERPKMVLTCVSGGGLKSATWAMQVLRTADSITNSSLMQHTVLMSGASGGMIGMAYFRELYQERQNDTSVNPYDVKHIYNVSKDLLNPIAFTIVTNDLFMPRGKFKVGTTEFIKDRGYIFEQQLNENTQNRLDKSLADYKHLEQSATIPMLFITPYIVNDARRVVISPHSVSYMAAAPSVEKEGGYDLDAVDFQRLFRNQSPDSLRFLSALRMNATYPYVLPRVTLPTKPDIEVMDAGYRDNFGLKTATRFTTFFKDWIKANTSGIVIVAARGIKRNSRQLTATDNDGIIESLVDPLGIVGQIITLQDYEHDADLSSLQQLLGTGFLKVLWFVYEPSNQSEEASMTFHLTERERKDILEAISLKHNQKNLSMLKHYLE